MRAAIAAQALAAGLKSRLSGGSAKASPPLVLVVSKDRAIQMELFLRSYAAQFSRPLPLTVLYRASSEAHRSAYEQVFADYQASALTAVAETKFKPDLLRLLREAAASGVRKIVFFVDDIVFIQPIDSTLIENWDAGRSILSLRLGKNITHSFNRGGIVQPQPATLRRALRNGTPLMTWKWVDGELDWALPTSLDGHLLPLPELIPVIDGTQFKAPNSLEGAIGQFKFLFKWRHGHCYEQARLMNLPLNTVKTEDFDFPNQGWDAEELLEAFQKGYRLDISELPLAEHNSCHMAWIPLLRKTRTAVGVD